VFLGNQIFKILAIPWIADFAIGPWCHRQYRALRILIVASSRPNSRS
jgi:hypothetical protein